jgi:hypothetical protein
LKDAAASPHSQLREANALVRCVVGNFKPMGTGTAHQRLVKASGIDPHGAVGGSIKPDGTVALNSESINKKNYGKCDASGTKRGEEARRRIENGEYKTRGKKEQTR